MTVPEAIEAAKGHLTVVLPELNDELQLEELETPPFKSTWRFTFSTTLPNSAPATTLAQLVRGRRISKSVEIDSETGALLAVKNVAA